MELLGKGNANFGKGKGKGKESFPKARKRNRKGTLSFSGSRKGKGTLSGKFWKVSTTDLAGVNILAFNLIIIREKFSQK